MAFFQKTTLLRLALVAGLLSAQAAAAQTTAPAPQGYDFLTVTTFEGSTKAVSRIFITPAFQGKTEVQLEDFTVFSFEKNKERLQQNMTTINQQLSDLTVAGWELVQVYPLAQPNLIATRYLLRRPRP